MSDKLVEIAASKDNTKDIESEIRIFETRKKQIFQTLGLKKMYEFIHNSEAFDVENMTSIIDLLDENINNPSLCSRFGDYDILIDIFRCESIFKKIKRKQKSIEVLNDWVPQHDVKDDIEKLKTYIIEYFESLDKIKQSIDFGADIRHPKNITQFLSKIDFLIPSYGLSQDFNLRFVSKDGKNQPYDYIEIYLFDRDQRIELTDLSYMDGGVGEYQASVSKFDPDNTKIKDREVIYSIIEPKIETVLENLRGFEDDQFQQKKVNLNEAEYFTENIVGAKIKVRDFFDKNWESAIYKYLNSVVSASVALFGLHSILNKAFLEFDDASNFSLSFDTDSSEVKFVFNRNKNYKFWNVELVVKSTDMQIASTNNVQIYVNLEDDFSRQKTLYGFGLESEQQEIGDFLSKIQEFLT